MGSGWEPRSIAHVPQDKVVTTGARRGGRRRRSSWVLYLVPREEKGVAGLFLPSRRPCLALSSFPELHRSPVPAFHSALHSESHSRDFTTPSHLQPLEPCLQLSHLPQLPSCWSHCSKCLSSTILLMPCLDGILKDAHFIEF